jgi:hypothetical protein
VASEAIQIFFCSKESRLPGHVISEQGVSTYPMKITAIANWPSPKKAKQLRSFLGLATYYRKFVRNFGVICKSLSELLKKKNVYFTWIATHEEAFQAIKQALIAAHVLGLPDYIKKFQLGTYASVCGVGAVLMQ